MIKKVKVGLIGSGDISWTYLQNMTENFGILDVVGCSDLISERSAERAERFGIKQMTNEEILNDPEIQIVLNTTYPSAHYDVSEQILKAGKHVYTEKMMAVNYDAARKLCELANSKNLRIGCAPDTFLSAPYQTARKIIDEGWIGRPVSALAQLVQGNVNDGADPLPRPNGLWGEGSTMPVDMGGYYIHALVHLLGPVSRVAGFSQTHDAEYLNPKNDLYGQAVQAGAPTSSVCSLEFKNSVIGALIILGECSGCLPRIEIYGTQGNLYLPDPNYYSGPLLIKRRGSDRVIEAPLVHDYNNYNRGQKPMGDEREPIWNGPSRWLESRRGLGVADMAWAIVNGRPHRCSLELGLHAFEIVHGVNISCENSITYKMTTCPEQPAMLPSNFIGGAAEKALDTYR